MPYIRCDRCGATAYSAAPWARAAECPNCGSPLIIPRHGALEARTEAQVRFERVGRWRRAHPSRAGPARP